MVKKGLAGFKGQGMLVGRTSFPKLIATVIQDRSHEYTTPLSGSYNASEDLVADVFAYGGGAAGSAESALSFGGGGGAAGHSRLLLARGQTISWTVGVGGRTVGPVSGSGWDGGDTIVRIDGVVHGIAQGGRRPNGAPAPRSSASGFQVNRYGGGSGERGEQGIIGPFGNNVIFGGSAGGFGDLFGINSSSVGNQFNNSPPNVAPYGSGGRCGSDTGYSAYGGSGLLVCFLYRFG
jgi:hypothetical protein